MKTLRRWQLKPTDPVCLTLAADARLSATDYTDDQIWEVVPGTGESAALALQTRFGGRAGLVSIVPMVLHDGRAIYQAQAYTRPPVLTYFAPAYLCFEAALTPSLGLQLEFWAMESHAVGIRISVANNHTQDIDLTLDIISFVGLDNKEQHPTLLAGTANAVSLGKIGRLQSVLILDQGTAHHTPPASAKVSQTLTVQAGKSIRTRLVHAALEDGKTSAALAQKWLSTDWSAAFSALESAAAAIPVIETGDVDQDATIAFAYRELMHSFLRPTQNLPAASLVATRDSEKGYNTNDKGWNGQSPLLAYLNGLAVASITPQLAQGLIRNYLAVQQADGWIDNKPGLGGQKQGILCMPVLARLSWSIFQYTEDSRFLDEIYTPLRTFFQRWLQPDIDADHDGFPEWQHEAQTGYVFIPTFAAWQAWSEGADIGTVESPDLAAYLLSEAKSLKEIAYFLRDKEGEQYFQTQIDRLAAVLDLLWKPEWDRYAYRDRDSHRAAPRQNIIIDARGTDELLPAEKVAPPNRLVVRVSGGVNLLPRMTLKLDGVDEQGNTVSESAAADQFIWAGGRGVYTSRQVFSQLDRVGFSGLSRVYRVDVHTVDTTRLDINALLPLWSTAVAPERTSSLVKLLTRPDHFWRASGVTMNSAQDPNYDPRNADGSGGVWAYWLTLMGEALIEVGEMQAAAELLQRLLKTQTQVLKAKRRFSEFYNSDRPEGLGESGHAAGIVPLHLLMRVLGIRVVSDSKVWVGGAFMSDKPVTLRQHGVTVHRESGQTTITFPNGTVKTVHGTEWQEVTNRHD